MVMFPHNEKNIMHCIQDVQKIQSAICRLKDSPVMYMQRLLNQNALDQASEWILIGIILGIILTLNALGKYNQ